MENHVLYTLPGEKYEELKVGRNYTEVWRGLPDLDFKKVKSKEGHDSLLYQQDGDYIWVRHDAIEELKKNPQAILMAQLSKTADNKINAWCVHKPSKTSGETLESIISSAKYLNTIVEE